MKTTVLPKSLPRSGVDGQRNLRRWLRLGALLPLALALLAPSTFAQDARLKVDVASFGVDENGAPQAVVTVVDADGQPVQGLVADAFAVALNGAKTPVSAVNQGLDSSLGIAVVMTLDVSASMQGAKLEQAKTAAQTFLQSLGPEDSVAVVTFANTVDVRQQFTTDRAAAAAAIDQLTPSPAGGTKLYDATAVSVNLATQSGQSRRAVVLLSDGIDNASGILPNQTLAAVGPAGVPVFSIGLGGATDVSYLNGLAQNSGGSFAGTASPEGLAQLYQQVGELLRGQYVLTLDTGSFTPDESGAASLRVEVTAGASIGTAERAVCFQPTCIILTGIAPGDEVDGKVTLNAQVISSDPVGAVAFLIDGKLIEEVTEPPYQFTVDPATIASGDHTIEAQASVAGGESVTTAVVVQKAGAGGGFVNTATLMIGAVVAIIVAVLVFLVLRFRRGGGSTEPVRLPWKINPTAVNTPAPDSGRLRDEDTAPVAPQQPVHAAGVLRIISGPHRGTTYDVSDTPAGIGSGLNCLIRLSDVEDGAEIAPEEARVWVRDHQLMLHEVRRLTVTGSIGGNWAIVGSGEQFSIGPCTFEFRLEEKATSAPQQAVPALEPKEEAAPAPSDAASAPNTSPEPQFEPLPETGRIWPREAEPNGGSAPPAGAQANADVSAVPKFEPLRRTGQLWPVEPEKERPSTEASADPPTAKKGGVPPTPQREQIARVDPSDVPNRSTAPQEEALSEEPVETQTGEPGVASEEVAEGREGVETPPSVPLSSADRWAGLPDIFKSPKTAGSADGDGSTESQDSVA